MKETKERVVVDLEASEKRSLYEIARANKRSITGQIRFWISIDKPLTQAAEG